MYIAETVATAASFDALAREWAAFGQARANPLLSHAWFAAAAGTLHADDRLAVISIRRNGRLAGAAPLAEVVREGARHLEFVGSHGLYEPAGFLFEDDDALRALCDAIVAQRSPAALLRLPAAGPEIRVMRSAVRRRGLLLAVASPPCIQVDLADGWQAYRASRSRGLLAEVSRKKRQLAAAGGAEFQWLAPGVDQVSGVIDEAADVEADGWKGRSGSAMRRNPRIFGFVRELAMRLAADGTLRVAFLRSSGIAIAMRIMIEWNERLWAIKTGFRESARRASPGMLLTHDVLEHAGGRGLSGVEFLGSGDPLQPAWGTGTRSLQSCILYPYSLRGAWTLAVDAASSLRRRRKRPGRTPRENLV